MSTNTNIQYTPYGDETYDVNLSAKRIKTLLNALDMSDGMSETTDKSFEDLGAIIQAIKEWDTSDDSLSVKEQLLNIYNSMLSSETFKTEYLPNLMPNWQALPLGADIDNLEDGFYYVGYDSEVAAVSETVASPYLVIQKSSYGTWRSQIKIGCVSQTVHCRTADGRTWSEWVSLTSPAVLNTLTSTSTTNPLSANQGRVLKELIDELDATTLKSSIATPEMHRVIYRGKNLGSSVTDAQKAAIKDGSFDDLFIGDYWVIANTTWRIVDMDYWYNFGYYRYTEHHLVIMPDRYLYTAQMNGTGTTDGGYIGSEMYTTNLARAETTITNIFGDLIFEYSDNFSNAVTEGCVSGVTTKTNSVAIPTSAMMIGFNAENACYSYGYSNRQFALFSVAPQFIASSISCWDWLRDVKDSSCFVGIANGGLSYGSASRSEGVRPVFAIKGA